MSGARHMEQQNRNKQTVISFYDLVFNQCKPVMRIERYAGDVYIHNPAVADDEQTYGAGVPLASGSSSNEDR
jgi:predicted SnoaL-like aldol condensation-catalyzing enzyme